MPQKHYTHFLHDERVIIAHNLNNGNKNISDIARQLGRDKSSVSREIKRNSKPATVGVTRVNKNKYVKMDGRNYRGQELADKIKSEKELYYRRKDFVDNNQLKYTVSYADTIAKQRKIKAGKQSHPIKIECNPAIKDYVLAKLEERWSPEQISGRLKLENNNITIISHKAIYDYIHRNNLIKHLRRRGKPKRKSVGKEKYNQTNREKHSIHDRPDEVEQMLRVGDLEGDTIVGKDKKDRILTHTERLTGLTSMGLVIQFSSYRIAEQTRTDLSRIFYLAKPQTITYDNGVEFSNWKNTEKRTNTTIYFADAYTPSQRGCNENINGLIRDFFPKGTDFKKLTEDDILRIESLLNNRPRKRLGWLTPKEAYVALSGGM